MAFQEVSLNAVVITDFPDQPLTGYYLGSREVDTDYGEANIHEFEKEDGKRISIWGFTVLDKKLSSVAKGSLTRVTYKGKESIKTKKYGVKDVHTCMVEVDPSKSIADRLPKDDGFKPVDKTNGHGADAPPKEKKPPIDPPF